MARAKRVYILTRQQDGSWALEGDTEYTEREAQKIIQVGRILGGLQSRTFPVGEYQRLHPKLFSVPPQPEGLEG